MGQANVQVQLPGTGETSALPMCESISLVLVIIAGPKVGSLLYELYNLILWRYNMAAINHCLASYDHRKALQHTHQCDTAQ